MDSGDARLRLYLIGLLVAFALYLLADGPGAGLLLWTAAGLVLAGLLASIIGSAAASHGTIPIVATTLAALLVCGWPLGTTVLSGAATLPAFLHQQVVWPQILVLMFASRVFSEHTRLRFAKAWLEPLSGAPARTQSAASALALGACLTLVFYLVLPETPRAASPSPAGVMLLALTGTSPIHTAIIFLFFVIIAHLLDAMLAQWREELAFRQLLRIAHRTGPKGADAVRAHLCDNLRGLTHLRPIRLIELALRSNPITLERETLAHLHTASRRFVRALVPILPLLGFLGTVIGLATALGQMPVSFGGAGPGEIDLARSLAGLSIKFETTLLGLIASMVTSIGLAVLERHEAELEARAARFVESLSRNREDQGNAQS